MTGSQWVGVILVVLLVVGFLRFVEGSWRETGAVLAALGLVAAAVAVLFLGVGLTIGAVTL